MKRLLAFSLMALVACFLGTLPVYCAQEPDDPVGTVPVETVPDDTGTTQSVAIEDSILNFWSSSSTVISDALRGYYTSLYEIAIIAIVFMGACLGFVILIKLIHYIRGW